MPSDHYTIDTGYKSFLERMTTWKSYSNNNWRLLNEIESEEACPFLLYSDRAYYIIFKNKIDQTFDLMFCIPMNSRYFKDPLMNQSKMFLLKRLPNLYIGRPESPVLTYRNGMFESKMSEYLNQIKNLGEYRMHIKKMLSKTLEDLLVETKLDTL